MSDPDPEGEGEGEGDEEEKDKDAENAPRTEEEDGNGGDTQETDGELPQSLKNCHVLIKNCSAVSTNTLVDMSVDHNRADKDDAEVNTTAEHGDDEQRECDQDSKEQNSPDHCEDLGRHSGSPHNIESQRTNIPRESENSEDHSEDTEALDQNDQHEDDSPDVTGGTMGLNTCDQEENEAAQNFAANSDLDEEKAEDPEPQDPDLGEVASLERGPKSLDMDEDRSHEGDPRNPDLGEKRLEDKDIGNTSLEDEERSEEGHNDDDHQSQANQDPYDGKEQQRRGDNYEREHSVYEQEHRTPDEERGSNGQRLGFESERYEHELHQSQRSDYVGNMENGSERAKYEEAEQMRYDRQHELEQMQKARYAQEVLQHHQDGRYDHGHRVDGRHYANSVQREHREESRYGHETPMKTEPVYDQQEQRSCYEPRYDNGQKPVGFNPSLGFKQESGQVPRVKQELGNGQEVQVKQEPLQPPAPPVKRGPGRPRNGSRPEGYVPPIKVKVEPKETVFEIMNNLEQIFKGAFLQDSEEEDAVEDENFITVQVVFKPFSYESIIMLFSKIYVSR